MIFNQTEKQEKEYLQQVITLSLIHIFTRDGQEFELKAQGWNPLKEDK